MKAFFKGNELYIPHELARRFDEAADRSGRRFQYARQLRFYDTYYTDMNPEGIARFVRYLNA